MLAGTSEVLVIADKTVNQNIVAANLIEQAAHNVDVVACAILLSDN
jgi:histidinol dehydrogenase